MADTSRDASNTGRVLVFAAVGAALGLVWKVTQHPHAYVMFKGYIAGFGLILLYRMLSRAPGLRRVLRPTQVTREGVYFLVLTLVFGAASFYTGDNLLHLIVALLLGLLFVSGLVSGSSLSGLRLVRAAPELLPCDVEVEIPLTLTNPKWLLPSVAVGVEEAPGDLDTRFAFFPYVGIRGSRRGTYRLRATRRGALDFGDLRLVCRFPFGLFVRDRLLVVPHRSHVLPRLHPLRQDAPLSALDRAETAARQPRPGDAGEDVIGLRDYRFGDPIRRIHWPTSARRGSPVVRELSPPDVHRVVLVVDSWTDDGARAEAVEAVLRLAAALAIDLRRRGRQVGLLLPDRPPRWADRSLWPLLADLARCDNPDRPLADSLNARSLPPGKLVALLAGGPAAAAALGRLPARRTPLVIQAADETRWLDTAVVLDPAEAERAPPIRHSLPSRGRTARAL